MEEEELQEFLNKTNAGETFSPEEVQDLLRQVLHWKSQYNHEKKLRNREKALRKQIEPN